MGCMCKWYFMIHIDSDDVVALDLCECAPEFNKEEDRSILVCLNK